MKSEYYWNLINKDSLWKFDTTPIYENKDSFKNLINDLSKPFKNLRIDKVAGLESIGFISGASVALKLGTGFVAVRKEGRTPLKKKDMLIRTIKDYTGKKKTFELAKHSIKKGDKILIVDDWIETGNQIKNVIKMIEKLGGKIVGISVLVAEKNRKTKFLFNNYNLKYIKEF
ncbi:hypothetical protein K9L67_00070 [Candidatus Woesearchaeota archaeon]|nr:hypothetical protein [Candidatus Woesearchaeota archaeon]MCF7900602.1 hypothetical protein [Candidatus Woesearchaeota archaeon]MCF8013908.1 hypothetical protein [Candidatus Woesearchaeota archaeon]